MLTNWAAERIESSFVNATIRTHEDLYAEEGVQHTPMAVDDNDRVLDAFEASSAGLLTLVQEQSIFARYKDEMLLRKLLQTHSRTGVLFPLDDAHKKEVIEVLQRDVVDAQQAGLPAPPAPANQAKLMFHVRHTSLATVYDAQGLLAANRGTTCPRSLRAVVSQSRSPLVASLLAGPETFMLEQGKHVSDDALEGSSSHRVGNYRGAVQRMLDAVADQAARPLFVRCLLANHNRVPGAFNPRSVAAQLRAQSIVPALWAPLVGYAFHARYEDFYRHFVLAAPNQSMLEEAQAQAQAGKKETASEPAASAKPEEATKAKRVSDADRFASMSKALQARGVGKAPQNDDGAGPDEGKGGALAEASFERGTLSDKQ